MAKANLFIINRKKITDEDLKTSANVTLQSGAQITTTPTPTLQQVTAVENTTNAGLALLSTDSSKTWNFFINNTGAFELTTTDSTESLEISNAIKIGGDIEGIDKNGKINIYNDGGYDGATTNLYYKVGEFTLDVENKFGILEGVMVSRYGDSHRISVNCERGVSNINTVRVLKKTVFSNVTPNLTYTLIRTSNNIAELWVQNSLAVNECSISVQFSKNFELEFDSNGQVSLPTAAQTWNEPI